MRERLEAEAARCAERGFCLWWWRERSSGELVGYAGLSPDEVEGEPAIEVGWSIAPERQGDGFATEAAIASIAWGFDRCGLQEIVSFTLVSNLASRRVMEKAGMEFAREIDRAGLPHVLYVVHR